MKRLFKKLIRTLWLISAPVCRPIIHRFDHHVMQLLVRPTPMPPPAAPGDLDMTLNSVVRELGRIQMQVEALQQQIDEWQSSDRDGAHPERRLAVVSDIG